jgi:hypothetical protein
MDPHHREIILKWIIKKQNGKILPVLLAQYKGDWWALINKITDIWAPPNGMDFFTSWAAVSFITRIPLHKIN